MNRRMFALGMMASAMLWMDGPASAGTIVIDFEQDAAGPVANGFMSADSTLVAFFDSNGANLLISDFGIESDGQGLFVGTDTDDSLLTMEFATMLDSLSMDIGGDDPALSLPGDIAVLTAYLDGDFVGSSMVVLNRDNAMNQTITFDGDFFNGATIQFYVSTNQGLAEIVDNITAHEAPGPGIVPLLALAAWGLGGRRRQTP